MIVLGVLLAAGLGALIRAAATNLDGEFMRQMYGTAAVNIVGSFLLGLLVSSSANAVAIVGVGGLGTLTTFSTYISQIECLNREGSTAGAALYGLGSLIAGVGAAYLGWTIVS